MLLALATACAPDRAGGTFHGVALGSPYARPDFTLTDFNGKPYSFINETQGKVALVFFGYTHCPDVCPLHMANIAAVLKNMPSDERSEIITLFVTTDPARDTPARLKQWLANFDPSFVGLTGSTEQISGVMQKFSLPPVLREADPKDSSAYFIGHAAQVIAFARDGNAYLEYPFGIRQEDWANDLPLLARDPSGEEVRRRIASAVSASAQSMAQGSAGDKGNQVEMAGLVVTRAVVAQPPTQSEASLYLAIRNGLPQEDTLVAVAADLSARAEIHETMGAGEMAHMMPVKSVPLPSRMETRLYPGGTHVMLIGLKRELRAGDEVTVYLSLAKAGAVEVRATVVPYADLEKALGTPILKK